MLLPCCLLTENLAHKRQLPMQHIMSLVAIRSTTDHLPQLVLLREFSLEPF